MKNLLIKYLYLNYTTKVFGSVGNLPRASTVIMPVFCLAILFHVSELALGYLTWVVFSGLIVLTFPIVKSKLINWSGLVVAVGLSIASIWYDHNWYEPLVFLYFSLGFLVEKTRFLFPVKYADLKDWEQRFQYISKPYMIIKNDETLPKGTAFIDEYNDLREDYLNKYKGDEQNVNVTPFLVPLIAMAILIILFAIFGSGF